MPAAKTPVSVDPVSRLARECAKLDKAAELAAAEDFLPSEARWPEY